MEAAPFIAFDNRAALARAAAETIAEAITAAIASRGEACIALSGGSTPEPAYSALAAMQLDWPRVTLVLVDERFAPPSEEASNERMVTRAFASAIEAGAHFKPLYSATPTPVEAADRAEALYAPLHIDLAVMGMGTDAHTASWFPGAAAHALDLNTARTVVAVHAPGAAGTPHRLTLTRTAYNRAGQALLLITGADKRHRLETALSQPIELAPVAALLAPGAPKLQIFWAP
jgi:6-phosphogluconolactonase